MATSPGQPVECHGSQLDFSTAGTMRDAASGERTSPTDATMITVRRASSQGDREKIFRLRYEIYVEEMRRRQTHADHALRFIEEPFDDASAVLLLAEQDGEAVGTVRINFARHGPLEE